MMRTASTQCESRGPRKWLWEVAAGVLALYLCLLVSAHAFETRGALEPALAAVILLSTTTYVLKSRPWMSFLLAALVLQTVVSTASVCTRLKRPGNGAGGGVAPSSAALFQPWRAPFRSLEKENFLMPQSEPDDISAAASARSASARKVRLLQERVALNWDSAPVTLVFAYDAATDESLTRASRKQFLHIPSESAELEEVDAVGAQGRAFSNDRAAIEVSAPEASASDSVEAVGAAAAEATAQPQGPVADADQSDRPIPGMGVLPTFEDSQGDVPAEGWGGVQAPTPAEADRAVTTDTIDTNSGVPRDAAAARAATAAGGTPNKAARQAGRDDAELARLRRRVGISCVHSGIAALTLLGAGTYRFFQSADAWRA